MGCGWRFSSARQSSQRKDIFSSTCDASVCSRRPQLAHSTVITVGRVSVGGAACVLVRQDVYERGEELDFSPWTPEEMDLLAAETADLLAGDGLEEPDDS